MLNVYLAPFEVDIDKLLIVVDAVGRNAIKDEQLLSEIENAQRTIIERNVKNRLYASRRRTNYSADWSKNSGRVADKIALNITSGISKQLSNKVGSQIIAWTGNIAYLDANDPILKEPFQNRRITHDKVRLWRILEIGTLRKRYEIPARIKPALHFFHQKIGLWVKSPMVVHPGTSGNHYFFRDNGLIRERQSVYVADRKIVQAMQNAFSNYIKKYVLRYL